MAVEATTHQQSNQTTQWGPITITSGEEWKYREGERLSIIRPGLPARRDSRYPSQITPAVVLCQGRDHRGIIHVSTVKAGHQRGSRASAFLILPIMSRNVSRVSTVVYTRIGRPSGVGTYSPLSFRRGVGMTR